MIFGINPIIFLSLFTLFHVFVIIKQFFNLGNVEDLNCLDKCTLNRKTMPGS